MPNRINLIHITDLHFSYPEKEMPEIGISTKESLQRVVQRIQDEPRDAIICTGDLVDDPAPETYQELYSVLDTLGTPVLCLPGNHDEPQVGEASAHKTTVKWPASILMGNWQLIFLNTLLPGSLHGFLGEDELRTLDQQLTKYPNKHALVCLHHHPIKLGSEWLDDIMLQDSEALFSTLKKHSHVKGLLWGHVHQEHDSMHDGIRLLSSPSTCRQFKPHCKTFAIDDNPPAYRRLALINDGTILTETVYCDLPS